MKASYESRHSRFDEGSLIYNAPRLGPDHGHAVPGHINPIR